MSSVAAEDGESPVPVSFRYNVAPLASMKAFVFKPNQPDGNSDSVKSSTLGGYYAGSFQKLIRNSRASVVWEAGCMMNFEKYCQYYFACCCTCLKGFISLLTLEWSITGQLDLLCFCHWEVELHCHFPLLR